MYVENSNSLKKAKLFFHKNTVVEAKDIEYFLN